MDKSKENKVFAIIVMLLFSGCGSWSAEVKNCKTENSCFDEFHKVRNSREIQLAAIEKAYCYRQFGDFSKQCDGGNY